MASEYGHHDVVQSLLGAGAEVNIAKSDVSDVTCVHRVHVHPIYQCMGAELRLTASFSSPSGFCTLAFWRMCSIYHIPHTMFNWLPHKINVTSRNAD